jgi:hypothetical protein
MQGALCPQQLRHRTACPPPQLIINTDIYTEHKVVVIKHILLFDVHGTVHRNIYLYNTTN